MSFGDWFVDYYSEQLYKMEIEIRNKKESNETMRPISVIIQVVSLTFKQ